MDLVVTVPQDFWLGWLAEGDLPGDPPGGAFAEYDYSLRASAAPPPIEPGERVYVVAHGRLRGYAPLVRVQRLPDGRWSLVRAGGAVACTIAEVIPGFRGARSRWWDRAIEGSFPTWRTDGVAVRCATHRRAEAVLWIGGYEGLHLFAFGLCEPCAARFPEVARSKGLSQGRDYHVLADLRPAPARAA